MKRRLFVAADIPKILVEDFSTYQKTLSLNEVRWTKVENYHLTIAFLGYVDESNLTNLENEIGQIASQTKSFDLHYESLILAPPGKDAQMIWAKLAPSENFANLVGRIYSFAKPYITELVRTERIPHITLARFREDIVVNEDNIRQPQLRQRSFTVSQISLMESKPEKTESQYLKLATFNFSS